MIRILITLPLAAEALERLNEIPEFEICEKPGLSGRELAAETSQAEALVCGRSPAVGARVLQAAPGLRLIIPVGHPAAVDAAAAAKRGIEVRPVSADRAGAEQAIVILKDFFNV